VSHRLFQVMFFQTPVFFKGVEQAVGVVHGGRLDLAPSSFDGVVCRWRAQIRELEWLGCVPGRWATAEGFFYFDSFQSYCAMGPLQLMAVFGVFVGGGGGRRGGRASVVREGSRSSDVILFFLRVLCEVWLSQLSPYPLRTCLYLVTVLYVFLA